MKSTQSSIWGTWRSFAILLALLALNLSACEEKEGGNGGGGSDSTDVVLTPTAAELAFRNAVKPPPPGWTGPVFELSHDYPKDLPPGGDEMPWLKVPVDFTDKDPIWEGSPWVEYMQIILDYVREGQDPLLTSDAGFDVEVGGMTRWYHVPWMAYNPNSGREFIHGCTSERVADQSDLTGPTHALPLGSGSESTENKYETWAFGVYNEYGGHAIGQTFPANGEPNLITGEGGRQLAAGLPFQQGTCVMKMLFTNATPEEVPYLAGSPAWQMHRHKQEGESFLCKREVQLSYLVQMDVAVVDHRSPTNWVFGTFAYDGNMEGESPWDRLAPVGIQWGNDPETYPAVPEAESAPPYQSVLNRGIGIYEHFGCNGRLAGPVDNKEASCMSCHGGSFTAPMNELDTMGVNIPPIFGFGSICGPVTDTSIAYYSNRRYPEPYNQPAYAEGMPLDFSLQLQVAFTQYKIFAINGEPTPCTD